MAYHNTRPHTEAVAQNGALVAGAKPNRAAFILRWVDQHGSFRGDGLGGPDYRAALRLAATDLSLELVRDDSVVRDEIVAAWRLRRKPLS